MKTKTLVLAASPCSSLFQINVGQFSTCIEGFHVKTLEFIC
jgi:hypothetical protein